MTQEHRELLLKELCARAPYNVNCEVLVDVHGYCLYPEDKVKIDILETVNYKREYCTFKNIIGYDFGKFNIEQIKPYLRPMSSMTKEERTELGEIIKSCGLSPYGEITESGEDNLLRCTVKQAFLMLNYLYSKHFDINHLIDPGLAIEAPEGMYK